MTATSPRYPTGLVTPILVTPIRGSDCVSSREGLYSSHDIRAGFRAFLALQMLVFMFPALGFAIFTSLLAYCRKRLNVGRVSGKLVGKSPTYREHLVDLASAVREGRIAFLKRNQAMRRALLCFHHAIVYRVKNIRILRGVILMAMSRSICAKA